MHRLSKLSNLLNRWWIIRLLVIGLVACDSATAVPTPSSAPTAVPVILTITRAYFPESNTKDLFTPGAGEKVLVVDLTIENNTNHPVDLFVLQQLWLEDGNGQQWGLNIMLLKGRVNKLEGTQLEDQTIRPGKTARGSIAFIIPEDKEAAEFKLVLDAEDWGTGLMSVALP